MHEKLIKSHKKDVYAVGRTSKADVAQKSFLNRQFAVVVDEMDLLASTPFKYVKVVTYSARTLCS